RKSPIIVKSKNFEPKRQTNVHHQRLQNDPSNVTQSKKQNSTILTDPAITKKRKTWNKNTVNNVKIDIESKVNASDNEETFKLKNLIDISKKDKNLSAYKSVNSYALIEKQMIENSNEINTKKNIFLQNANDHTVGPPNIKSLIASCENKKTTDINDKNDFLNDNKQTEENTRCELNNFNGSISFRNSVAELTDNNYSNLIIKNDNFKTLKSSYTEIDLNCIDKNLNFSEKN
ncbi:hypothetical protein COBT_003518, partial [Conglomerata obtusa]